MLKNNVISLDCETVSLEDRTLVGFSVAGKGGAKYYPIAHNHPDIKNVDTVSARLLLQGLIDNNEIVFHNSSFDVPVLTNWGINFDKANINDTLIIANLLDENIRHGLKALSKRYLHYTMTELKEIVGTGKKRISVADADKRILKYAADDAKQTLKLYNYLYPLLQQDSKLFNLYETIEKPLLKVIADMHINGIVIDAGRIKEIEQLCTKKTESALEKLEYVMEGVNYNSTKQLRAFFIDKERMPIIKTTDKGAPSMDKEVLEIYAETNSTAKLLLEYRKYAKILSTFIPALSPKDIDLKTCRGKIYPSFNQAGTKTARFSSSRPNFQNLPRDKDMDFRACIVASKGNVLVGLDFSQIELRVLAHFTQDFRLMKAYKEGIDIHKQTAETCGVERNMAKILNFGLNYGMGVKTLSKHLKISLDEAQNYTDRYFDTYNRIKPYWEAVEATARKRGYVETAVGRKRHLSREFQVKDNFGQSCEIRSLINSSIQGTAGEILKIAMVGMYLPLKEIGAHITACIHDEVIVECPKDKAKRAYAIVSRSMIEAGNFLSVPLEVDGGIGDNWRQIHG